MAEYEGHDISGGKKPIVNMAQSVANSVLLVLVSRIAMPLIAFLLWDGLTKIDKTLEQLNSTVVKIQIEQGRHDIRINTLERAGLSGRQQ